MSDLYFPEVLEVVQFGVEDEDAKGTKVEATKRFFAMMFDMDPKKPTLEVRQAGNKHPVGSVTGKGHTEGTGKGDAAVEDLMFVFGTMVCLPTFSGNTASFAPLSRAENRYKSLTVEKGQAGEGNAGSFGFGVFTECDLDFVPDKQVALSTKIIGQQIETTKSLSDTIVTLANSTLFPTEIDVFIALTEDALLDNQINPLSVKWKFSKAKQDVYTLKSQDRSFSGLVETAPDIGFDLVIPKGGLTNGYLDSIDSAQLWFIEVQARGGLAADGVPFSLTVRAPFYFSNPSEGAAQDVHTATFNANVAHDETFNNGLGGALLITCHSNLTEL